MNSEQKPRFSGLPFQHVADMFSEGAISHAEAAEYCRRWNESGKHFTVAYCRPYVAAPGGTMGIYDPPEDGERGGE